MPQYMPDLTSLRLLLKQISVALVLKLQESIYLLLQSEFLLNIQYLLQNNFKIFMDHIPSQSISKSILLATPLFLFVLAVLHASSQLSYMFILNFVYNVGGSADILFIPTLQPEVPAGSFKEAGLKSQFGIPNIETSAKTMNIPLVNTSEIDNWVQSNSIIRGASPRWLLPTKASNLDTILLATNIQHQIDIGITDQSIIRPFERRKNAAVEQSLMNLLGLKVGDKIPINVQPKNMLAGIKMFEKFQEHSSKTENKVQVEQFDPKTAASYIYDQFGVSDYGISKEQFGIIVELMFEESVTVDFMIQQSFYSSGLYPSKLNNVIVIELEDFYWILSSWVTETLLAISQKDQSIRELIPAQYRPFWPESRFQIKFYTEKLYSIIQDGLKNWGLMMVTTINYREDVYRPDKNEKYALFAETLQKMPANSDAIVLYPLFKQSLAIKFFFDSVVQIFEFVTCILYFYTMTLIMKQIYEEKQIEVGIWRTLGAGAVSHKQEDLEVELIERNKRNQSKFHADLSIKEKIQFYSKIAIKVGFVYYWLAILLAGMLIYVVSKIIIYHFCAKVLKFEAISQPVALPIIIMVLVLSFLFALCFMHIRKIFKDPLSETIKPVKRTFDVVKVRIIHLATFGVSLEVLMIALMLIYYGVVSYYWIPFAVLDGDSSLQIILLNSIFIFMIFGAIILLSILQSRLEILIFKGIFRISKPFRCLKLAILKNIKAKQYKNIKVAIIVSIIFAFVLFFTAGINIQIQIIQSFVERALGSNLVFENYGKEVFDADKVEQYLNKRQNIQYAWLSERIDRDQISIQFISHISGDRISPQIQILSPTYLNSSFYEYYYPQQYMPESSDYWKLPNSLPDGFNSIYKGKNGQESVGKFNADDTLTETDPYDINVKKLNSDFFDNYSTSVEMPPDEQVIDMVVSSSLRKQLGVDVGEMYKMEVRNNKNNKSFYIRAKITHSFKQGPGFDILRSEAFLSIQQAEYLYRVLEGNMSRIRENEKLLIKGEEEDLSGIANAIIAMSPDETQAFDLKFISQSFSLLSDYLNGYIVFITVIMSGLVILFLFLYTIGKCQEEAEMFKMLRSIGLSAHHIRIMIFAEIMVRICVSIFNGIVLGIILSVGFSMQIEQFLMLKTPTLKLGTVLIIAAVLMVIFSITVIRSTQYLTQRTVANTNRKL